MTDANPRTAGAASGFLRDDPARPGVAEEVVPGIRRLLCPNPGPLTFTGTNTWLLGGDEVTLIDPGPDLPQHREAILRVLGAGRLALILVSHTHLDHSAGAAALSAATGAPVAGFGTHGALVGPGADTAFRPDRLVRDEGMVPTEAGILRALHTPGHCPTHLCFALEERQILFSGDHVMSWSSTVVFPPDGSMGDYMRSLARVAARDDRLLLPGHGPPMSEPAPFLGALRHHREARETAVLAALKERGAAVGPEDLVAPVYGSSLAPELVRGAAGNIFAHLLKLVEEGRVMEDGGSFRPR